MSRATGSSVDGFVRQRHLRPIDGQEPKEGASMSTTGTPTVVLVHGAFADGSGFRGIILELRSAGITGIAPANPLRGLAFDAEYVKSVVEAIDGPVVLVGHSYGGAVITQAAVGLDNVVALVYLAAFALDEGESALSLQRRFEPPHLDATMQASTYAAGAGAADGPDLIIDRDRFRETFCPDVPVDEAAVMAATQRPLAAAAYSEKCTAAAWKSRPSWYLISDDDNSIRPSVQRFMAKRIGATTETLVGSHGAYISRPVATADFILRAVTQVTA
jgi:pimeloyl-ACP methyl ester carboxylesterase